MTLQRRALLPSSLSLSLSLSLCLSLCLSSSGAIINPIVDTDRSVNTTSIPSIAADLIKSSMSDEQKLFALFSFHRRMMHHSRLEQNTEDSYITFDPIKLYTVYGHAFCTQNASVFRALCNEVFGSTNTEGTAGEGTLLTTDTLGGHSSFHVRFNSGDKWHWIDPTIGAYVRMRGDNTLASHGEIAADPSLFNNAEAESRASVPFFPCTRGSDPLEPFGYTSKSFPSAPAYGYYDYDSTFVSEFSAAWTSNLYTNTPAYFTTRKSLQKGETYLWDWDYYPGDYFNLTDRSDAPTRDWNLYPPRHLCGAKDSADTVNWKYFKPYAKDIKGQTSYRYAANGTHTFEPDLQTTDPKDRPAINKNTAFYADNAQSPALRPTAAGTVAEIAYRFKFPYPIMSLSVTVNFVRASTADSLALFVAPLYFDRTKRRISNQLNVAYPDTLSLLSYRQAHNFAVDAAGSITLDLRSMVDPLDMDTTFQGYAIKFVMRAATNPANVGINRFKSTAIFEHNMFALPQLEPGVNNVTVTNDSGALSGNFLKVGFKWMDNGVERSDQKPVTTSPFTYGVTVNQSTVPRMLSMWVSNARTLPISIERAAMPAVEGMIQVFPNPSKGFTRLLVTGFWLKNHSARLGIYDTRGRLIRQFDLTNDQQPATSLTLDWSGLDSRGLPVPTGIYLVRAQYGKIIMTRRLTVIH